MSKITLLSTAAIGLALTLGCASGGTQSTASAGRERAAVSATACLCKCVSSDGVGKWSHFEPGDGACSALDGQSCANDGALGLLEGCKSAPRPVTKVPRLGEEDQASAPRKNLGF